MKEMCPCCANSMKWKIRGYHLYGDGDGVIQEGGLVGVISPKLLFLFSLCQYSKAGLVMIIGPLFF